MLDAFLSIFTTGFAIVGYGMAVSDRSLITGIITTIVISILLLIQKNLEENA